LFYLFGRVDLFIISVNMINILKVIFDIIPIHKRKTETKPSEEEGNQNP